jgi:hypothetical protein
MQANIRRQVISLILLVSGVGTARADIAVLREKGPLSAAVFSNPGRVDLGKSETKVAMRSANVRIVISAGANDLLIAKCQADFELEDLTTEATKPETILVAFPVTGLTAKSVAIRNFKVTVDGETPPTALRRTIFISRRESRIEDTPLDGQLDARFLAESYRAGGVKLSDESVYPNAYVWSQETKPGAKSHVSVSYQVELRPQELKYAKSYQAAETDNDVVPFQDLQLDSWNDRYYLFDYILLSGSTWSGPIGKEVVSLTVDPALKLARAGIHTMNRRPVGFRYNTVETSPGMGTDEGPLPSGWEWRISGKPDSDIMIAIAKSAIGKRDAAR